MERLILKVLTAFAMLVSTTYSCWATGPGATSSTVDMFLTDAVSTAPLDIFSGHISVVEDQFSYREELVTEVGRYLASVHAPSDITADHIVNSCLQNDFDITFLLAQGTLETGMGNAGAGKSRKSVFGVVKRRFATRNDAVTHYINLIISRYYNGSWDALLANFVSKDGYRYAARGYEKNISGMYRDICKNWPRIQELQEKYYNARDRKLEDTPVEKERSDSLRDLALSFLGLPYIWGASGPNSFDCSGLTSYVYRQMGVCIPRTAAAQWAAVTPVKNPDDFQAGDLIFFRSKRSGRRIGHVGMIVDTDSIGCTFIHAESSRTGVRITRYPDGGYYQKHYAGTGRVQA